MIDYSRGKFTSSNTTMRIALIDSVFSGNYDVRSDTFPSSTNRDEIESIALIGSQYRPTHITRQVCSSLTLPTSTILQIKDRI